MCDMPVVTTEEKDGIGTTGPEITEDCDSSRDCQELKWGLLQQQHVLSTAEPSPQAQGPDKFLKIETNATEDNISSKLSNWILSLTFPLFIDFY